MSLELFVYNKGMSEDANASADSKLFGVIGKNFLKRFHQGERKVISYVKDVKRPRMV